MNKIYMLIMNIMKILSNKPLTGLQDGYDLHVNHEHHVNPGPCPNKVA